MHEAVLSFHHLGLAVIEPTQAIQFLTSIGYTCDQSVFDPVQNVHVMMCYHPQAPNIEIIYPSQTPGPLTGILKDQSQMIYHIGYSTQDLNVTLKHLKEMGNTILCVSTPKPAILFSSKLVSFYLVNGFGLIEIIEN